MNLSKEVFVIHKVPYQENSEIITAVSQDGMIKFIAKGIKKQNSKNKIACEIGTYAKIEYIEKKQLHILTQAQLVKTSIQNSYLELLVTQLICDIAYQSMFDDYEILKNMQHMHTYHKLLYFLYHVCKNNGIILQVDYCVRTNNKDTIALSLKDGGLISKQALQMSDVILTKPQQIILKVLARVNQHTIDKYNELAVDYFLNKQYLTLIAQQLSVQSKIQHYIEEEQYGKSI